MGNIPCIRMRKHNVLKQCKQISSRKKKEGWTFLARLMGGVEFVPEYIVKFICNWLSCFEISFKTFALPHQHRKTWALFQNPAECVVKFCMHHAFSLALASVHNHLVILLIIPSILFSMVSYKYAETMPLVHITLSWLYDLWSTFRTKHLCHAAEFAAGKPMQYSACALKFSQESLFLSKLKQVHPALTEKVSCCFGTAFFLIQHLFQTNMPLPSASRNDAEFVKRGKLFSDW